MKARNRVNYAIKRAKSNYHGKKVKVAYYSSFRGFFGRFIHARTSKISSATRGKYHASVKKKPNKNNKHGTRKIKYFPLISRVSIFMRASSLLRVEKSSFLLRNRSILPSRKLCFLDNADLSNTGELAIS